MFALCGGPALRCGCERDCPQRPYARGDEPGGTLRESPQAQEVSVAVSFQRNIGMLLLAIWLILYGVTAMAALALPAPLMAVLALLAGILILAGR